MLDSRFRSAQGCANYEDNRKKDVLRASFGDDTERSATRVTDRALDWLGERLQEPFFLWAHHFDAHAPHAPHAAPLEHWQETLRSPDLACDKNSTRI